MDWRTYPEFILANERGILPHIKLPENFREIVPRFYEQGRKQIVERYVDGLGQFIHQLRLRDTPRLNWDSELGLRNISVGIHGGLDLNEGFGGPCFQEHNLGTCSGYIAGIIAMKYILELLKCK